MPPPTEVRRGAVKKRAAFSISVAASLTAARFLLCFVAVEARASHPVFPLQLFRIRAFTFRVLSSFLLQSLAAA